jgi:hypothetical protein
MNFGDIISKHLNFIDKEDYDKLKELFIMNNIGVKYTYKNLSNFINTYSDSIIYFKQNVKYLITKILLKILNNHNYTIDNCKEFINQFNNNQLDFLSLDILKKLTFLDYGDLYTFDEFIKEYQLCYENFEPFMNKLFNLGYKFTEEIFYYYCDNGLHDKLVDFYINNIIKDIDYKSLNIDNHIIIKKIIQKNYNNYNINNLCFANFDDNESICICYEELLNNGYTFTDKYILLLVLMRIIDYQYKNLLNHPEIIKYFNQTITISREELIITSNKYNLMLEDIIYDVAESFPKNTNKYFTIEYKN